jgi:hypothetical protein
MNQPATIAPIEYVVLTKPSNSPAYGVSSVEIPASKLHENIPEC